MTKNLPRTGKFQFQVGILKSYRDDQVYVNMGDKPLTWFSLRPKDAIALAKDMITKANIIQAKPKRTYTRRQPLRQEQSA